MKLAVVLSLCLAGGALSCKPNKWDLSTFSKATLDAYTPLGIGALFGPSYTPRRYGGKTCGAGEKVVINRMRVYAPHSGSWFTKALRSRFSLETVDGSKNKVKGASTFLETSCFDKSDISTGNFMSSIRFEISCKNIRKQCDPIYYKLESTCEKVPSRRLLADTRHLLNVTATNVTGVVQWDSANCPVFNKARDDCVATHGANCSVSKVPDTDFEAVCNEYKTSDTCLAAIKESTVLKDYQYYCDSANEEESFDGTGCPEFTAARDDCIAEHGDDCGVSKVSNETAKAVCAEYINVAACKTNVDKFEDMNLLYNEYCDIPDVVDVTPTPAGKPQDGSTSAATSLTSKLACVLGFSLLSLFL